MDCCKTIELLSNDTTATTDSGFELGLYKQVTTSIVDSTDYPVYQFHEGSDTLVYTRAGRFWRVSNLFYADDISAFCALQCSFIIRIIVSVGHIYSTGSNKCLSKTLCRSLRMEFKIL